MGSACDNFQMHLSAFADGELSARDRSHVELHLSGCEACRARLKDLRALSHAVAGRLMAQADSVDFSRFADQVLARVTPERPSFLERWRVAWAEVMAYHRVAVVSSLATAAVTLAVAVPLVYRFAFHEGATASPEVVLRELKIENPDLEPVVMKTADGKVMIMLVDHAREGDGPTPPEVEQKPETIDIDKDPPKEGDL